MRSFFSLANGGEKVTQKLEGKLAGLEPIIGTPQTSLGEAVSAGTTHGGLHFPRDHRFTFSGVVAENDQKLQTEIEEWQKRCLVEVANHQQTEAANAFSASSTTNAAISQNGAQPPTGVEIVKIIRIKELTAQDANI